MKLDLLLSLVNFPYDHSKFSLRIVGILDEYLLTEIIYVVVDPFLRCSWFKFT